MKYYLLVFLIAVFAACSNPNRVYVVTAEYHNGDKVCRSFIGSDVWLDGSELKVSMNSQWSFNYDTRTELSGVRSFEITSTGDLTSK